MPSDTVAPKDKAAASVSSRGSLGGVRWTGGTVELVCGSFYAIYSGAVCDRIYWAGAIWFKLKMPLVVVLTLKSLADCLNLPTRWLTDMQELGEQIARRYDRNTL